MGSGQPGVSGDAYRRLMALPNNDLVTYHDFQANDEPMPGAAARPTRHAGQCVQVARQLGKPLMVDESGHGRVRHRSGLAAETAVSRSAKLDAKLKAFYDAAARRT